jgi:hypothetical protein
MVRQQHTHSASKNNILFSVAHITLFYSNILVLFTLKLHSTGILHILQPYIFFTVYAYFHFEGRDL